MKKIIKNITRVLFSLLLIVSIFGAFNVLAQEIIFKVTNIEVKEKSDGVTVNDVSLTSGAITNDIVFTDKDDYIKYNITIKNSSDKDYTIKSISDDNDSTNLEYTYDDLSNVKVNKGEEKTFELTITYKTESTTSSISSKKVNLSITYEDESGNVETSEVKGASIENPKTGDDIYKYIIMGGISLVGLGLTLANKKKLSKSLMVVGVASTLIIPFGVRAESETFQIVLNNTIKAKEYTVTFNTNGGSSIDAIKVVKGGKVTKPSDPSKDNNDFKGWYTTSGLSTVFDFSNTKINSDTEIFAKWEKIVPYTVVSGNINTMGSEVCIQRECFYVIGMKDDSHVIMLSKYNLGVGKGYTNPTTIRQSASASGYASSSDDLSSVKGTLKFIDDNSHISDLYWGDGYDGNVFDSESNLYSYVQEYNSYLTNLGANVTSRLMLEEDFVKLGLDFGDYLEEWYDLNGAVPSWVYSTGYWTGIGPYDTAVSGVAYEELINDNYALEDNYFGVRPVIIMEK